MHINYLIQTATIQVKFTFPHVEIANIIYIISTALAIRNKINADKNKSKHAWREITTLARLLHLRSASETKKGFEFFLVHSNFELELNDR